VHLDEEAQADHVDYLWTRPRDRFRKWGKLLDYYPAYILLGVRALQHCRKNHYDVILSWEAKNAFGLAMLRSALHMNYPPHMALCFNFKGVAEHFPHLSRFVMKGIDYATVVVPSEPSLYVQKLGIPPDRVTFIPIGWHDLFGSPQKVSENRNAPRGPYVLASGRSYRDYGTFFQAVTGVNAQFVVNARPFNVAHLEFPPNVIFNDYMPPEQFLPLMRLAAFIVVPLQYVEHAAGEGHIVQAMCAGKAIVATRTPSTEHYIEHGKTGLLVRAGDPRDMRAAIEWMLQHPEAVADMGTRARKRYEAHFTAETYWRKHYELIKQVAATAKSEHCR
jgi:glycosyltransferase involved in cell wall biosynthesis